MPKVKKPAPKKGGEKKAAPKKKARKSVTKLTERQADQIAADRMRDESYAAANKPQAMTDSTATLPLHPTVEEQWENNRVVLVPSPPAPKRTLWSRFRSAITGLFVSKQFAEAHPDTTVREKA